METGIRLLLLAPSKTLLRTLPALAALALCGCGLFGASKPPPLGSTVEDPESQTVESSEQPVIEPQVTRRKIKQARIDTEDFEVGAYVGLLSIEDFGSNAVYGARLTYHITEDFFLEGKYGVSKAGTTSFERLAGSVQVLSDDDREYSYYALNAGWAAFPGEIFIGRNRAYNSNFYLSVGIGGTRFADDNHFTANIGLGYRILLTDWAAVHLDFHDYLFDTDLLVEKKVVNNLEGSLGLTVFF
jgi:outer membrane beta-barrel protein